VPRYVDATLFAYPARTKWRSGIVDTDPAGAAHSGAVTDVYQERSHPQVDCIGAYVRIWERMIQAEGTTTVVARRVHRDRPPDTHQR
jgi:hypothetical protein